ncbi:DUF6054 family protein [Lawsonibacter sp.]|uniref:DUF6054 family protein n=1 Tax=Lawsonibacter sp. TaxID=2185275 RepID=UPI00258A4691|nr:DUF6054 family protein [Lawsonibacter sp.]MCI6398490.1 DUF6054 family protein [Lawsonibacter sp.]MDY2977260.1 DUF6054 family protein [Oscillospiraceae bacterium]
MAVVKTLYPAGTAEECARRITETMLGKGFSQGREADRYTVETASGTILVLVFEKYFLWQRGNLTLTAVLDTAEGGAVRAHLIIAGANEGTGAEKKLLEWLEKALPAG